MEQFGASPDDVFTTSAERVAGSDIFIGIISMRYGTIDPARDKSASEVEYDQAKADGVPILMYTPKVGLSSIPHLTPSISADEEHHRQAFLKRVVEDKDIIYEDYDDPNKLAYFISVDLTNFLLGGPQALAETRQGMRALQLEDWDAAISQLEAAHNAKPSDGAIAFAYALALLRGRSPGLLREKSEVLHIEQLLRIAMLTLQVREVIAFWGVVKEEVWDRRWGSSVERADAHDLFGRARNYPISPSVRALLEKVQESALIEYSQRFA